MTDIPRERWNDLIDFLSGGPFFDVVPVLEDMRGGYESINDLKDEIETLERELAEAELGTDAHDLLDEIEQLILSRHNR